MATQTPTRAKATTSVVWSSMDSSIGDGVEGERDGEGNERENRGGLLVQANLLLFQAIRLSAATTGKPAHRPLNDAR